MVQDFTLGFVERAMARRTAQIRLEQNAGLLDLAVIARIAPLFGLFGAVCSVMLVFRPWGTPNWQGRPQIFAGLVPALQCLLGGLLVAMLANFIHRLLQRQVDHFRPEMEQQSQELIRALDGHMSSSPGDLQSDILGFVERAMQRTIARVDLGFRTRLHDLATTASVAPLLGFSGTVYGITNYCFKSYDGPPSGILQMVFGGLTHSLPWTLVGLAVGIAASLAYRYLQGRADAMRSEMNEGSLLLLNQLSRCCLETEL